METRFSQLTRDRAGWHGSLKLVYGERQQNTEILETYSQSPLKIQRPFYPEGKEVCHSVILHTAGGMVGGDNLSQTLQLLPKAKTLITTAAASKIYRSNGQLAKNAITITLEPKSCLEFLPQETIIFNGATYYQTLKVELAPSSHWLGWEITRFGRSARGEKFLQGEWRSDTEVWQQGTSLWLDRQYLSGGEDNFHSPNTLAGKPVVGTLSYLGKPISQAIVEAARNVWHPTSTQGEIGVTRLAQGLLCRYRGHSILEVRNWFTDVWHLLRLNYLGRPAIKPRVWQH